MSSTAEQKELLTMGSQHRNESDPRVEVGQVIVSASCIGRFWAFKADASICTILTISLQPPRKDKYYPNVEDGKKLSERERFV